MKQEELLFIWVDDYRSLKRIGINLSNNFNFEYKYESGELIIENKLNNGLFEMNSIFSLTGIVGQNGVGKSSILELIYNLIYDFSAIDSRLIFVFGNQEKATLYRYAGHYDEKLRLNKFYGRQVFNKLTVEDYVHRKRRFKKGNSFNTTSYGGLKSKFQCYFFSNVVDGNKSISKKNNLSSNLSFRRLPNSQVSFQNEMINAIQCMHDLGRHFEIDKELSFPEFIDLDFSSIYRVIHNNISSRQKRDLRSVRNSIREKLEWYSSEGKYNSVLEVNLISSVLCFFIEQAKSHNGIFSKNNYANSEEVRRLIDEVTDFYISEDPVKLKEILHQFLSDVINLSEGLVDEKNYTAINKIRGFAERIDEVANALRVDRFEYEEDFDPTYLRIKLDFQLNEFVSYVSAEFPQLIRYIKFSWRGRSSGEIALLNFYSRFYSMREGLEKIKSPIIILIDEADLYLHPRWQRDYIKNITVFFNTIYPEKSFQIILTTHSPFIVSDLPRENLLMIDKTEENRVVVSKDDNFQSFGSNFYEIIGHSFFLSEGIIGSFATDYISQLFEKVNSGTANEEDVEKSKLIGDKILRQILVEKINNN